MLVSSSGTSPMKALADMVSIGTCFRVIASRSRFCTLGEIAKSFSGHQFPNVSLAAEEIADCSFFFLFMCPPSTVARETVCMHQSPWPFRRTYCPGQCCCYSLKESEWDAACTPRISFSAVCASCLTVSSDVAMGAWVYYLVAMLYDTVVTISIGYLLKYKTSAPSSTVYIVSRLDAVLVPSIAIIVIFLGSFGFLCMFREQHSWTSAV
jgi:hypothetical protein